MHRRRFATISVVTVLAGMLVPTSAVWAAEPARGSLDSVTRSADGTQVTVAGWTFDPGSPATSTEVHIYSQGSGYARRADQPRQDVNAVLGVPGQHGFVEKVPLVRGSNSVCAFAISTTGGGNSLLGCRTVQGPTTWPPEGSLDSVVRSADGTQATVAGWTVDRGAPTSSTQVHIYVQRYGFARRAGQPRPDVNAVLGVPGNHGFIETVPLVEGNNEVCAFAIAATSSSSTLLGCRAIQGPAARSLRSAVDRVSYNTFRPDGIYVDIHGWALDLNRPGESLPVAMVGNSAQWSWVTDQPRPDVNAAFGVAGQHGFTFTFKLERSGSYCLFVPGPGFEQSISMECLDLTWP